MDKDQIARLKELAEKADAIIAPNELWAHCNRKVCADFISAANPQTVLELIADIERLEKEADWLAKQALAKDQSWRHNGFLVDYYTSVAEWREAARKAVEGK